MTTRRRRLAWILSTVAFAVLIAASLWHARILWHTWQLESWRVETGNASGRSEVAFIEIREEETTEVNLTLVPRDG